MKKIVFTLCSNNYLAHAKTLGDSIKSCNPECTFIIGLVDEFDTQVDYKIFEEFEIIPFQSIGLEEVDWMLERYDIVEFNTAVKPFYFSYLFQRYDYSASILYLDPDILVLSELNILFDYLKDSDILLTPNILTLTDEVNSGELASLRHGKFNLGFIGLRHSANVFAFLKWWQSRLRTHCLNLKAQGLFVDQKWIDLAPLFFDNIKSLKEPGLNMAWWNLHERTLFQIETRFYVNDRANPLYFFHFSGYHPGSKYITGRNNNAHVHSFELYPGMIGLFRSYEELLKANRFAYFSALKPKPNFRAKKPYRESRVYRYAKAIYKMIFV